MEIKVYKTYEISAALWERIAEGFRRSFNMEMPVEQLKNSFCIRNKFGYGYHVVALADNGEVAGYSVDSPSYYKDDIKMVVCGSSFVCPEYRRTNEFLFWDMMQVLSKEVAKEGFQVSLGVPNQNAIEFSTKIFKAKHIGDLNYYLLPLRVSKCIGKPALRFLDPLSVVFAYCHVWLHSGLSALFDCKEKKVKYELLTDEEDLQARFKGPYKHVVKKDMSAYYRVCDEDGKKVVYLMDFRERGERAARSLGFALRRIIRSEHPDAVLFVGFLRMTQAFLLKVPKKFEPKRLPLTYVVISKADRERLADLADIGNWNFSLMNFDVR